MKFLLKKLLGKHNYKFISRRIKRYVRPHYYTAPTPVNEVLSSRTQGPAPELTLLIATFDGLLLYSHGTLTKLLNGQFYGVTKRNSEYYVFEKAINTGRIIRFQIKDNQITNLNIVIKGLSPGIHQIDFIDDSLLVVDTYNNRLLKYALDGTRKRALKFYPIGKLDNKNRREASNYAHLNSIWKDGDSLFLVLHNDTAATGKKSEVLELDLKLSVRNRFSTPAACAHNFMRYRNMELIANSLEGELLNHGKPVCKYEFFTRGLSVTEDYIILGASNFGPRKERGKTAGFISVLDHQFKEQYRFEVSGAIQDIRCIDRIDYSFSNSVETPRKKAV